MTAAHGLARFAGGLIVLVALVFCIVAFLFLGLGMSHYSPSIAQPVAQLAVAMLIAIGIAVLGLQFAIDPSRRPGVLTACLMLGGALLSAVLLSVTPPGPSFVLTLIAVVLGGGAGVIGAQAEA